MCQTSRSFASRIAQGQRRYSQPVDTTYLKHPWVCARLGLETAHLTPNEARVLGAILIHRYRGRGKYGNKGEKPRPRTFKTAKAREKWDAAEPRRTRPSRLAKLLNMSRSSVTRAVRGLEAKGVVMNTTRNPRQLNLALTPGPMGIDALWGMLETEKAEDRTRRKAEKAAHLSLVPGSPTAPKKGKGRNDLCPCGSGLKYKKCCGAPEDTRTPEARTRPSGNLEADVQRSAARLARGGYRSPEAIAAAKAKARATRVRKAVQEGLDESLLSRGVVEAQNWTCEQPEVKALGPAYGGIPWGPRIEWSQTYDTFAALWLLLQTDAPSSDKATAGVEYHLRFTPTEFALMLALIIYQAQAYRPAITPDLLADAIHVDKREAVRALMMLAKAGYVVNVAPQPELTDLAFQGRAELQDPRLLVRLRRRAGKWSPADPNPVHYREPDPGRVANPVDYQAAQKWREAGVVNGFIAVAPPATQGGSDGGPTRNTLCLSEGEIRSGVVRGSGGRGGDAEEPRKEPQGEAPFLQREEVHPSLVPWRGPEPSPGGSGPDLLVPESLLERFQAECQDAPAEEPDDLPRDMLDDE